MNILKKTLKKLKGISLDNATVSFYVVKRHLAHREASYDVLHVNVDEKLRKKLRGIAAKKIQDSNDVREYDFTTSDLDNDVLGIKTSETDLQKIVQKITGGNIPDASQVNDILESWLYIAGVNVIGQHPLYFVRQISSSWNTKRVLSFANLIFKDNLLIDVTENSFFKIDSKIDFFSFEDTLFIIDKKNFEIALNFRIGMEKNRDAIIEEIKEYSIVEDTDVLLKLVGNNIPRMRKLSQLKKAGYYKSPQYMAQLRKINKIENWGLSYNNHGKIVVTKENVDNVLRFLNNDRLSSKINEETFDVDVKHKL